MERENLTIIDGKSVFYRGYYAMGNLSLPDGTPTGGVYGFAAMLIEIIEKLQPEYIAVAWDKAKTNIRRRREIYPEYKGNRKPAPPDFYAQIPYLMELLEAFHIPLYEFDDYEADDIIGTLARKAQAAGKRVEIISGDLDMLQIVDQNIEMYQLKRGFSDVEKFDIPAVEAKYGLKKSQFLDLKSIKGDSSDNIPGVPGIGEKGAVKLLQQYETLENLYDHVEEISGATGKKLIEGKDSAFMSKQLASIQFDAPLEFDPQASELKDFKPEAVVAELKKLQFNSLLRKFAQLFPNVDLKVTPEPDFKKKPEPKKPTSPDAIPTNILPPPADITIEIPKDLYLSQHVKEDMHADAKLAEEILAGRPYWDLGQVDFLFNPLQKKQAQIDLFEDIVTNEDYVEQRKQLAAIPSLEKIATEFDLPLIPVLYKMEQAGLKIDPDRFEALRIEFGAEEKQISQEIYEMVGHAFNINSPLQLSQVLFEELGLPTKGIKKTQRAYSTGQKELDKLRDLHPIIGKIERLREVSKLLSTYITPLPALADKNQRIHSTFTQDVTATGRLSSLNPNLQNIPVRSEDGKRIRYCFVPEKGKTFVAADYAQFELRLAAELAGDESLIKDFNSGLDIHIKTASDAYGIPQEQVTKEQRRAAKVINFGIIYGMSAKSLADGTGMTFYQAKDFIDRYMQLRAPIADYLKAQLEHGRKYGYVETFFGRRRPTPDLAAPNFLIRAAAERAAANMPIQGTEADLMKRAMLAVDKALPEGAKLVLQIHDSLMVECDEAQAEEVAEILKNNMENVAPDFKVKLAVDVKTANNWGEL